jgi:hypothetical protein
LRRRQPDLAAVFPLDGTVTAITRPRAALADGAGPVTDVREARRNTARRSLND